MAKPHNTIPPHAAERPYLFWRKVDRKSIDECWNWKGTISQYGYGYAIRQSRLTRTKLQAHRLAYFIHYGIDPGDLCVCHRCDNPACCNPHHLFLGTIQDNNDDMYAKGRNDRGIEAIRHIAQRGERHGMVKLTESQVKAIRTSYVPFVNTQRMLARKYGVSLSLIDKILCRQLWKHLE